MGTFTWDGSASSVVTEADNWAEVGAPTLTSGGTDDLVFTGTATNAAHFDAEFFCNSITIQNDTATGRGFRLNSIANLKGNAPLVIKKAGCISSTSSASVVFTGSAPTNNCYVTFLTDALLNTAENGMFDNSTSRANVTFKFKPGANISIALEDGVYPHLQFITDSSTVYFSPTFVPTQSNSFGKVDALSLDSDAPIKPLTRTEADLTKEFSFDGSLTLDMDVSPTASVTAHRGVVAADWGLSTVRFVPNGTTWYLPVNGDANRGPSGTAGFNTFNVKYHGLKIGKPANSAHYAQIRSNLILDCYSLEIEGGAKLYGSTLFTDINSSEIHTVKRPKVLGDWNYTQVAEGVYRARGSTLRLPVAAGGTGIEYAAKNSVLYGKGHGALGVLPIGTANQVLSVNSGADALEWAAAGGSANAFDSIAVSGQTSLAASAGDDLTLVAAGGMTITTNAGTDTITFSSADTNTTYSATANGGIGLSGTAFSLDIDGMTDIGEALVDADLMIVDNGAGGTNRKATMSRLTTYMQSALTFTTNTDTVDMGDGFKIVDSGGDNEDVQEGEYVKFVTATGSLGTNLTGAGTSGDPFLITLTSPDTNTTYSTFAGSTSPGTAALVPARDGGATTTKYLREDGDWVVPPDTTTNTQNTYTSSWVDSSNDVLLRLTAGGASSGTQDIKLVAGSNVSLTPDGTDMTIAATDTQPRTDEYIQDIVGAMFSGNTETNTAVTYQDGDGTIDVVTTLDGAPLTTEAVQDIVGAMFSSNTETRIAATYEDGDGTIDLVVDDMTADTQLTTEAVQDIVGAMFSGNTETNTSVTYQDGDGTIDVVTTLDGAPLTTEAVQDIVGAMFSGNTETNTSVTYEDGDGTIDVVTTLDGAPLTTEAVQDIVGAMFSSNTETRISATYEDGDGTIDLVVDDLNTNLTTEEVQDIVGGMLTGNTETNISVTYQDGDGTIDFVATDTDTVYTHPTTAGNKHVPTGGSSGDYLKYALTSGVATWANPTEDIQDVVGAMFTSNTETRISVTYDDSDGTIDLVVDDMTADTQLTTEAVQDIVGAMFTSNTETNTSVTYQDGDGTIDVVTTLDGAPLTTEAVQDIVGAMVSGNTETNISVTYQDDDGTLDFVATDNDTVYTHPTSAGNHHLPSGGSSGQFLKYSGLSGVGSWATPDYVAALTTEEVQDIVGAMVSGNTETNISVTYEDGDGTLDFVATDTQPRTDEYIQDLVGAMFSGNTETNTSVTYQDGDGTIDVVTTLDGAPLTTEAVQDIVGAMFTSNTETRIAATYEDGDGTIDLVVDDMTADTNTQLSTEEVQDIVGAMVSGNTETNISVTYQDGDGTLDFVATDTDTQLSTEAVQDIVGAMFTSNTETRISATYEDGDGTIDLVVDDMTTDANTQNEYATSWVDSSADVLLRLTESGAGSGTQDIKLVAGSNISLTPSGTDMTIAATDTDTVYTHPTTAGNKHVPTGGSSGNYLKYGGFSGVATWADPAEDIQDIVGAMFTSNTETRISVTYDDADGTIDLVVDDMTADTQLTSEAVQDIVGAMFTSNTETRIAATYEDGDGTIDLVVDDMTANTQLTTEEVQDIVGAMFSGNTETNTAVTYQDGDGTIDVVTTLDGAPLTTEAVQDIVGAMFGGNTETRIAVTYEDGDGTIDLVVDDMTADTQPRTDEYIQDIVGAMFGSNTETRISATYQDGDGTIDLVVDDMTADTNTTYSAGNGLALSTTTFSIADPATLTELDESSDATDDKILLWDETASEWKYMTLDNLQDAIDTTSAGGAGEAFKTISVSGQDDVVADGATDTLTLVGGSNVTITTSAGADSITFASTQYSHPTTAGNIHLPSGGSTGNYLKYGGISGVGSWTDPTEDIQDIVGAMFTSNTETRITATYEDSDGTIDLVVDDLDTNLTTEEVQDIVGAMFTSNTETRIAATYQDGDGTIDLVVDDMTANTNTQNEYATSWVDSTDDVLLRLTESGAGSGSQDIKLVAGSNISLTPSGTDMTIAATDTNTTYTAFVGGTSPGTAALVPARDGGATTTKYLREDGDWVRPPDTNDNTQNEYATSWVDSSADVLLRLTESGAGSGSQDIKLVAGSNITLTPSGTNMTIAASGGGSGDMTGVDISVSTGLDISQSNTTSGDYSSTITLDLTELTLGAGLDSTAQGLSLDLSELTDMTADVVGSADELILLDDGAERRKAINEIKLSEFDNDDFNSWAQYFYQRDSLGTNTYDLRIPVPAASTSGSNLFPMPKAGVVRAVSLSSTGSSLSGTATQTFRVRKNGGTSGSDIEDFTLTADTMVNSNGTNYNFTKTGLSFAVSEGDSLQLKRVGGSLSFGHVSGIVYVDFS